MVEEQKWEQRVQLVDRGKDNVLEQGSGAEETDVNKFRKCFGGKLSRPCWQIGFWPWEKGRKQGWVLHLCFEPLGRCLAIYWDRKDQGILCIRERGKQMKTQYREWKKKKKERATCAKSNGDIVKLEENWVSKSLVLLVGKFDAW